MCRHWSRDPLAKYSPSGLNATEYTGCLQTHINSVNIISKHNKVSEYFAFHSWYQYLWPDKLYRRRPCSTSQSLIVESKDALQAKQNSQSMLWCSSGPTRQETNSRQLYNPSYIYNNNNDLISVREQSAAIWDNNPNAKLAGTRYSAKFSKPNAANFVTVDHFLFFHDDFFFLGRDDAMYATHKKYDTWL